MRYSEVKNALEIEGHANTDDSPIIIDNRCTKLVADIGDATFEKIVASITFNQLYKLINEGILIASSMADYYILAVNCTPEMIAESI